MFLFRIVKRPRNPPPATTPSSTVIYSWPVTSMVLRMREPGLICVVHSRSIFIQHCYRACDSFPPQKIYSFFSYVRFLILRVVKSGCSFIHSLQDTAQSEAEDSISFISLLTVQARCERCVVIPLVSGFRYWAKQS